MRPISTTPFLVLLAALLSCRSSHEREKSEAPAMRPAEPLTPQAIQVIQEPSFRILYLEHVGSYASVDRSFDELEGYLFRRDIRPAGPFVGIYYDDPARVAADRCRADIGATVATSSDMRPDLPFRVKDVCPGLVVAAKVRGPYGDTGRYLPALLEWIGAHGYRVAGPIHEVYLGQMEDATSPADLETHILVPVAK